MASKDRVETRLISVPDAARMLGVGERYVWSMVATGGIESVKLVRRRLIAVSDIDRHISKNKGAC